MIVFGLHKPLKKRSKTAHGFDKNKTKPLKKHCIDVNNITKPVKKNYETNGTNNDITNDTKTTHLKNRQP